MLEPSFPRQLDTYLGKRFYVLSCYRCRFRLFWVRASLVIIFELQSVLVTDFIVKYVSQELTSVVSSCLPSITVYTSNYIAQTDIFNYLVYGIDYF